MAAANKSVQNRKVSRREAWTSTLFFGFPVALTFSLGVWQVHRLNRKRTLIAEREAILHAEPVDLSEALSRASCIEYQRVHVSGYLEHEKEMLIGPRSAPKNTPSAVLQWGGSSGFIVITPLITEDGTPVLVNRGWIPQRLVDRGKRVNPKVDPILFLEDDERGHLIDYHDASGNMSVEKGSSVIRFEGVTRLSDETNRFMPTNNPEKGEWFYVDVDAMLAAQGLQQLGKDTADGETSGKDVFVELIEPLPTRGWPFPRGAESMLEFRTPPSTHITYAATWFSLSLALALLSRMRARTAAIVRQ